ncbi:MAG: helicase-related protein [Candidatus Xenobia bacterium]
MMSFAVGALVKARGREWVVLPDSKDDLLVLRPLGGTDDEIAGIYLPLEPVESANFALPDAQYVGDYRSSRLLREALRLGFRSSAGPFRSFARIAVDPRPYQLVPLLMALKQDPVRLLIADDVGIGKTIEAALVARELKDRGEINRMAVLCPPHLAEQWQLELKEKFHIDAELVLTSTAARLERDLAVDESIFDRYDSTIVSTDFIKSDRRRQDFLRACPELVIVDEAHACVTGGTARHQRYQLMQGLAAKGSRHLILVTATPHSGDEDAFRSLLTLLNPGFAHLPEDLTGTENTAIRRELAQYLVQRKRGDICSYVDADTVFPDREKDPELTYGLSLRYRKLFNEVIDYARETVKEVDGSRHGHRQRVRWWSALALLRALASSPAAAAATLRNRAATADTSSAEEADDIGRRTVMDLDDSEGTETVDVCPGSDAEDEGDSPNARRLRQMADEADALKGDEDAKLLDAKVHIERLLKDGYQPIVFCRFIDTAEYLAAELRERLPKLPDPKTGKKVEVTVAAVTGALPPADRQERVEQLSQAPLRVLVCTDCLSEGINLQKWFNAVFHYDLCWNPTRHEQREGRVDRYGQLSPRVRVVTYFGKDNQIDGIVLDVLLRKHKKIRGSLGISVPVPMDTNDVMEAIFEGLLLRSKSHKAQTEQMIFEGFEEYFQPTRQKLDAKWDAVVQREERSRNSMFAQRLIKVEDIRQELEAARAAVGSGVDVAAFVRDTLRAHGAAVAYNNWLLTAELADCPRALKDLLGDRDRVRARFELPVASDEEYLTRTHPVVEALATYVLDTALDNLAEGIARRCGAIRTKQVRTFTCILLLRYRFHIVTSRPGSPDVPLLAEDSEVVAFEGNPAAPTWLSSDKAEALLDVRPDENIIQEQAVQAVDRVRSRYDGLRPYLEERAKTRGAELLAAHRRVRTASEKKGEQYKVEAQLPPDVLGIYVLLPVAQ